MNAKPIKLTVENVFVASGTPNARFHYPSLAIKDAISLAVLNQQRHPRACLIFGRVRG